MPARRVFGPSLQTSMSAVVHMYYATSSTHMKQIVRLGASKYIQLDSYGKRCARPLEIFMSGLFVIGIATVTAAAILGSDATQPFEPTHSTQTIKP